MKFKRLKGVNEMSDEKERDSCQQESEPTWRDFYAAKERSERAIILQKMYEGCLTPSELEELLDA